MWFSTLLLKNLLRRKFRSGLTCIGFAVAVGTTVALLGVSESFERVWLESMTRRGFDIIVVEGGKPDQLNSSLKESFDKQIAKVPGVKSVSPNMVEATGYFDGVSSINILIQGWEPHSVMMDELKILSGRWFTSQEKQVVVLGQQLAKSMHKKVGDSIELQGTTFQVLGIYQSFVVFENGSLVMPIREMQKLMGREGDVTGFALVLDDRVKEDQEQIKKVAERLSSMTLEAKEGYKVSLSAMPSKDYVSNTLYIKMAHAMAWMTSAIAIIVGSIGVLNTMIMSVVERVREISILRAIGWKKSRVVRMILGEALILSLVGAAMGIGTAILLVQWLTTLPAVAGFIEGTIAGSVFLKGILLAIAVGLLGGAYPAWHAAQMLPSEGLRHE
jgi:putative ABC transport system permease protein